MNIEKELLIQKAKEGYTICCVESCPLHNHCLRWLTGQHVPNTRSAYHCVNPNYEGVATADCPMYRNDQPIRMPLGIAKMYYDMPQRIARPLKQHLIEYFNRKRYYEYHSGYRPVPPVHEEYIRHAAQSYGWTGPIEFGGYVEDYLW